MKILSIFFISLLLVACSKENIGGKDDNSPTGEVDIYKYAFKVTLSYPSIENPDSTEVQVAEFELTQELGTAAVNSGLRRGPSDFDFEKIISRISSYTNVADVVEVHFEIEKTINGSSVDFDKEEIKLTETSGKSDIIAEQYSFGRLFPDKPVEFVSLDEGFVPNYKGNKVDEYIIIAFDQSSLVPAPYESFSLSIDFISVEEFSFIAKIELPYNSGDYLNVKTLLKKEANAVNEEKRLPEVLIKHNSTQTIIVDRIHIVESVN